MVQGSQACHVLRALLRALYLFSGVQKSCLATPFPRSARILQPAGADKGSWSVRAHVSAPWLWSEGAEEGSGESDERNPVVDGGE